VSLHKDAKLLGACAALAKPFSLDELHTIIAAAPATRVPRAG
jgi:hypothetical protein